MTNHGRTYIGRELRSTIWRALGYAIVLEAMLAAAILFWPDARKSLPMLKTLSLFPIAKELVSGLEQTGVQGYVILQHFFKGCNTLGAAAAILFAMGAVAGEAHRGTLEIWLARPLSRRRILLERYAQGALAVALPVLATSATIPWLLSEVGESLPLAPLMLSAAHQSIFLLAIYSVTFLASAVGERPTAIAFAMLLLSTFEFSIYLVKRVTHTSVFRLSDLAVYGKIFSERALDWSICGPLLGASAACLVLASVAFARRVP